MNSRRAFLMAVVALVGIGVFTACKRGAAPAASSAADKQRYQCPMHPQYTADKPGDCPICQMRLVPITDARRVLYFRNPMNPAIHSDVPMKDGMGMDYVPVYVEGDGGSAPVSGQGRVTVPAGRESQMGVSVSTVEVRDLFMTIKAPSRVAYDPGLYSAILEYQEAQKNRGRGSAENQSEADMTVRASKLRLRQMGLSDQQIQGLSHPGSDPSNLLLGQAGGKVWVYVDIYDYEAAFVKAGQKVEFASPALPGQIIEGTVRAVDSIVNSESRTLRVRVEVANPHGDLKPEMYLSAIIQASIGKKLAVPESAVMDTGVRQLVYVQTSPGEFEPREIRVGREATGYYEVVSGVKEGELVVTSANFLIDSESKIRATGTAAP